MRVPQSLIRPFNPKILAGLAVLALLPGLALAQAQAGQLATRDAHALLWLPDGRILLGHHDGIKVSKDGGKTWADLVARPGWDAMNLAWDGQRLFVAGHELYASSADLKTFADLKPQGLSGLDLHSYAVDPKNPRLHYAYEAGGGLFRSRDGGLTWGKLPQGTPAMAVGPDGTLFLAAPGLGLLRMAGEAVQPVPGPEPELLSLKVAADGTLMAAGKSALWRQTPAGWKRLAPGSVVLVAANPKNPAQLVWVDAQGQVWRR